MRRKFSTFCCISWANLKGSEAMGWFFLHRSAGCWRNLRLLEGNQEGFLASPAATLKQRLALTSDQMWPVTSKSPKNCRARDGYVWFEMPEVFGRLKMMYWHLMGFTTKNKKQVDFRWRWSMYINASYSVSLGRGKVFPPRVPQMWRLSHSICFYGWAIVFFLFLCNANPVQKVVFATAHWNFWNPLPLGIMMNKGALLLL